MSRLTVGLTGGVASGKSLVAAFFEELGVPVLDADLVARQVVAPGEPALERIAAHFGSRFLTADGQLDRRAMREHVFADPAARRELEQITHPAIRAGMLAWRERQTAPYCILSVAILIEVGIMRSLVDRVLVVDVPAEVQIARLRERDNVDAALAAGMLAAQARREDRRAAADDLLENTGTPDQTRAAVAELDAFYRRIAAAGTLRAPGICLPKSVA